MLFDLFCLFLACLTKNISVIIIILGVGIFHTIARINGEKKMEKLKEMDDITLSKYKTYKKEVWDANHGMPHVVPMSEKEIEKYNLKYWASIDPTFGKWPS